MRMRGMYIGSAERKLVELIHNLRCLRGSMPVRKLTFRPDINLDTSRGNVFEPSALSETLRPPLGVPEGDGNASGYRGRDRRLRPLRGEVGGMREYITDERCNRADRRLSRSAIDCPVHLCNKGNRNGRTDNTANRGEECGVVSAAVAVALIAQKDRTID